MCMRFFSVTFKSASQRLNVCLNFVKLNSLSFRCWFSPLIVEMVAIVFCLSHVTKCLRLANEERGTVSHNCNSSIGTNAWPIDKCTRSTPSQSNVHTISGVCVFLFHSVRKMVINIGTEMNWCALKPNFRLNLKCCSVVNSLSNRSCSFSISNTGSMFFAHQTRSYKGVKTVVIVCTGLCHCIEARVKYGNGSSGNSQTTFTHPKDNNGTAWYMFAGCRFTCARLHFNPSYVTHTFCV